MEIYVSNLSYMGFRIKRMVELPVEVGIELFVECGNDYYWKHHMERVMQGRNHAISLHGPCMNVDLSSPDLLEEELFQSFSWSCKVGEELGAQNIVMHPFEGTASVEGAVADRNRTIRRLRQLAKMAADRGLTLLLENLPIKDSEDPVFDQASFFELLEQVQGTGFLLDTGHAHCAGWDIPTIIREHKDCLYAYHIHDNDSTADSHLAIWEGTIDWDSVAEAVRESTPHAHLVLEYSGKTPEQMAGYIEEARRLFGC